MSQIYIPATSAEQWASFLAEPTKHWKSGYSARTLAYSWQEAQGFPSEVAQVLGTSPVLHSAELLLAIPEHQVALPGGRRASQNDIWALGKCSDGLISIAVEGKVAEPFGPTVGEWLAEASPGKTTRLQFLQAELGLIAELAPSVRYQLLHRSASAVIEAKRFCAPHAVMLVHSFSQHNLWFEDFLVFAALFGVSATPNTVYSVGERNGVNLHLAWVCGNAEYLHK